MKGKILGFDESQGAGAISAEDGTRHTFTRADWRGARQPAPGISVDFECADGSAREIYPVAGAGLAALGTMNVDLGGLSGSPQGERVVDLFTRSLAVPLALVVLLACFMSAISAPVMSVNLIDLGKITDGLNLAGAAASMEPSGEGGLGSLGVLLALRFLAPLSALWLIWSAWAGKPERLPMLIAGACAIGAGLLVIALKQAALSMVPDFVRDEFSAAISLGGGVWLLFLAGAALIAAALGKIRNPLAGEKA